MYPMKYNLNGMSARELRHLAEWANQLADDMEKECPSYELAIQAGITDESYDTTSNGFVESYSGRAVVQMENGSLWLARGHRPEGGADHVSKEGYIEFTPLT